MQNKFFKILFLLAIFFVLPNFASASTTIQAKVVRNEIGTGSCLISGGFPLPEGLVTEQLIFDGKIKVIVSGVEVSANVSALRGRHNDGTLRSMLIQFNYSLAQNDEVSAQVIIDGGVRTENDPAYIRPTLDIVTNNNVILPTDKNYLTTTNISLRGLIPEGAGSASEERFYTDMASDRFDWLSARTGVDGAASYEHVSALIGLFARSANVKYQKEAIKQVINWLPYNTPTLNPVIPAFPGYAIINPDNRTPVMSYISQGSVTANLLSVSASLYGAPSSNTSAMPTSGYLIVNNVAGGSFSAGAVTGIVTATVTITGAEIADNRGYNLKWIPYNSGTGTVPPTGAQLSGIPAEWYMPRTFGYAQAYLMTGYRDFWGIVAYFSQYEQNALTSQSEMYAHFSDIYGNDFPRTNYAGRYGALLAAIMIDATIRVDGQYFAGRNYNWENQLTFTIDALDHYKFNDPGQYWDGLAAGAQFSQAGRSSNRYIPYFQLVFPTNFLIDAYLYFKQDSRIPDLVQKMVDVELSSIRVKQAGDVTYSVADDTTWGAHTYVKNYQMKNPIDFASYTYATGYNGNATIPYELPEYSRMLAFVIKTKGDSTVNGFTYTQWYDKLINTGNVAPNIMNWQWKYFGQFYSWGMDAPWMMAQPSLTNYGPATMRVPKQYNIIPADVPDISRNYNLEYDATAPSAPTGLGVI